MERRDFIQRIAAGGAATAAQGAADKTAVFQVKGFTCVTCAIGLEVVLKGLKGVRTCKATYPEGKVTVGYDAAAVTEDKILALIGKTGFKGSRA